MTVPSLRSLEQKCHTNSSGNKKEWPVHMSLENINWMIKSTPLNLGSIVDPSLPIPPRYHHNGHGKISSKKQKKIHN
jgi:hypothetical protein